MAKQRNAGTTGGLSPWEIAKLSFQTPPDLNGTKKRSEVTRSQPGQQRDNGSPPEALSREGEGAVHRSGQ